MKYKDIIKLSLIIGILSGVTPKYSSPYFTDEIRSSPKKLLKFAKTASTIEDLQDRVEFYRAVSESFGLKIEKLNTKNEKVFTKFDKLILQYLKHIKDNVNEIEFHTAPEITYVYKPVKITKKSVQKQSHKKQALVLRKNYITLFKYYKEKTGIYTNHLKALKELKDKKANLKPKIAKVNKKEEKKSEEVATRVTTAKKTDKISPKELSPITNSSKV